MYDSLDSFSVGEGTKCEQCTKCVKRDGWGIWAKALVARTGFFTQSS